MGKQNKKIGYKVSNETLNKEREKHNIEITRLT